MKNWCKKMLVQLNNDRYGDDDDGCHEIDCTRDDDGPR